MSADEGHLNSERELERLYATGSRPYTLAANDLVVATAMGDRAGMERARVVLDDVIGATMGMADAVGCAHALEAAAGLMEAPRVNAEAPLDRRRLSIVFSRPVGVGTDLPRIQFNEMLEDLRARTPKVVRQAAERTAQRIAQMYGEGRVLAFVRATEQAVAERVQKLLVQAIAEGLAEREAGTLISAGVRWVEKEAADWTEAYSRMVYRTNLNTATTAGRFRQVQDQDVRGVIPALKFHAIGDSDCRANHKAANGLIFRQDNGVWNKIAPPLGYNCRCTVAFVSRFSLMRMGRLNADGSIREDSLPGDAYPDPGFRHGGRPDLFIKAAVA